MYRIFTKVPRNNGTSIGEEYSVSNEEFGTYEEAEDYINDNLHDYETGDHYLGAVKHNLDKSVTVSDFHQMIYLGHRVDICVSSGRRMIMITEHEIA